VTVHLELSEEEAFAVFEWLTSCGPTEGDDAQSKAYLEKFRPHVYAVAERLETPLFKNPKGAAAKASR
jgi:hypothetical protein